MPDLDLSRLPLGDIVATIMALLVLAVARFIANRAIRSRRGLAPYEQRRWIATSRNLFVALVIVALVMIWAPQLRTFALSLTAVAVAIVIATKELLLCFSGAVLRASTRAFSVGDWIEIAGIRGEVIDHSIFATTVYEFDAAPNSYNFAGRTSVVPNSTLLSTPVRNLSAHRNHLRHSFEMTFDAKSDVFGHREAIEEIVERHAAPHEDAAQKAIAAMARRAGVEPNHRPWQVRLSTTDLGHHRVRVTVFCPPNRAEDLQDAISREVALKLRRQPTQTETG